MRKKIKKISWTYAISGIVILLLSLKLITRGEFILGFSLLIGLLGIAFLLGPFLAYKIVEDSIIELLESQGHAVFHNEVISWYNSTYVNFRKYERQISRGLVNGAPSILDRLKKKNIIKIEDGIVYLLART